MTRRSILMLLAVGVFASACTVGPDYRRPEDALAPTTYRGADSSATSTATPVTFADVAWWELFGDPDLQALIRTALTENQDLQIAVNRILQAQAQYTQVRSLQFPTVDAQADGPYTKYENVDRPPTVAKESFLPEGGLTFAWELDLWGKFRRSTEAARAQLLASEDVRNGVVISLISQVAQSYFTLRAYDLDLEISKRTVASRQQSVELVSARLEGGVSMVLDLQQAQTLLYTATKSIPDIERLIEQTENRICILLGKQPGPIPRGHVLSEQLAPPTVPPGLPAELLARRPDIRQAEQQLVANALIGVAEAQLYPQVGLSAFGGLGGFVIDGSSYGPLGVFNALPFIKLPIFNAGALQAGVDLAKFQTQDAELRYRQTIQQALREVSDALVGYRKRLEYRKQQELLTKTLAEASEVSKMRYEGGVSSYLEVLDTERQYFQSELDLTQAQREELGSIVELYRALGGGWQAEGAGPKAPQG